jgi:hypothetical protein
MYTLARTAEIQDLAWYCTKKWSDTLIDQITHHVRNVKLKSFCIISFPQTKPAMQILHIQIKSEEKFIEKKEEVSK